MIYKVPGVTFDILQNKFILYKHKITSSTSTQFINNALIIKNNNSIQAINIFNGSTFWLIQNKKISKKIEIINIETFENYINIFMDNGQLLRISNNQNLIIEDLKVKNINSIYFQNKNMFISLDNGKTAIY